jgi:hypothetical protein
MKRDVGILDAVPSKRLFLSIIADYDLNKSVCELVDNGFDVWTRSGRAMPIAIDVTLDKDEQSIRVDDNAGGLPRSELSYIVGPGQSGSADTDATIGIFGVGTKRAVVALAKDVRIRTRFGDGDTFQIEFDDAWLNDEDWRLPLYQVESIAPGGTQVELQKLRVVLTDEAEEQLRRHLGATYGRFISHPGVTLRLNGKPIAARFFDQWSYPPTYEPRRYRGKMQTPAGRVVDIEVMAGLSNESSPASGEYGVYFYCNDRLVAPAMKSFEVGFTRGQAGLPHPKISLTKVIVSMTGDAAEMPWNSSKSDISTKHHTFMALHDWLVEVVKHYASVSRIWMGEWPEKVFAHADGDVIDIEIGDFLTVRKSFLPDPPKSRPRYGARVAAANAGVAEAKPYVVGLFEGVVAATAIAKQPLAQKNWLAFGLLDVTLTAAFKEYLVNESGEELSDRDLEGLLQRRRGASDNLKGRIVLTAGLWAAVDRFSKMKTDLTYGRATPRVGDAELGEFEAVVTEVLSSLFAVALDA